jgi:hypothetical protein
VKNREEGLATKLRIGRPPIGDKPMTNTEHSRPPVTPGHLGVDERQHPHGLLNQVWHGLPDVCRVHEALRTTPAVALGIADRVWTIGDLLDAALATLPVEPETTAPDRRRRFRVIEGGATSDFTIP